MATLAEQLAEINTAITAVTTGLQSYTVDNRAGARANLHTLLAERKRLEVMVARESSGGVRVRYGTAG